MIYSLEIARNICTNSCKYCFVRSGNNPAQFMTEEVLDSILESIEDADESLLVVSGLGEQILHPSFGSFVTKLKEKGFKRMVLNTTLSIEMTEELKADLLRFDHIAVELGGEETSDSIMRAGQSYATRLENLKDILSGADSSQDFTVKVILVKENEHLISFSAEDKTRIKNMRCVQSKDSQAAEDYLASLDLPPDKGISLAIVPATTYSREILEMLGWSENVTDEDIQATTPNSVSVLSGDEFVDVTSEDEEDPTVYFRVDGDKALSCFESLKFSFQLDR
ncbi:MAG: radical SAM protein [Candidatus Thorarchaeota archaeon]